TTVTANNKVYTATPTVDSFVPIGKQILEDLRSPYVGELESKNNEISLCKNKLKSIEIEIKAIDHKEELKKQLDEVIGERKKLMETLIKMRSTPRESTLPYRQAFNKILKDRIFVSF
ncbi:23192_t:CDS:2, partial [Entrophospora sp. SA101]